jgi:phosphatidylglycerol---prolipoprotein diacylglyceryl transferase
MQQVLFWIPNQNGIPVYGFGAMLFLVFVVTTWLTGRRAEQQALPGAAPDQRKVFADRVRDLVLWVFLGGILGARVFYLIQYRHEIQNPFLEFFQFWNGGIVFYGSALGGALTAVIAHRYLLSRFNVSAWQLADIMAPSIAIGLAIGRIGCLLNGCCFGHVAAPDCAAIHFPLQTAPARALLRDYQTAAGFAMDPRARDDRTVGAVEPDSAAAATGLHRGDIIVAVNGREIAGYNELADALSYSWPRGQKDVTLRVRRDGQDVQLPTYIPRTLGLVPTQLYESVSMALIFVVLVFLYPIRRYHGQLLVTLMLFYAVHRFFNEALRHDTPTYLFGLTISQWISVGIFVAGAGIGVWRRRHPLRTASERPQAVPDPIAQSA